VWSRSIAGAADLRLWKARGIGLDIRIVDWSRKKIGVDEKILFGPQDQGLTDFTLSGADDWMVILADLLGSVALRPLWAGEAQMRAIFAAIARMLASMPRLVFQRVLEAGEWITKWIAQAPPPAAPDPVAEVAAVEQREADQDLADIRSVAASMRAQRIPSPDLLGRIPDDHMRWLIACSGSMLTSIIKADDKSLRDHIAGRKSIRGVLITDPATVAEFDRVYRETPALDALKRDDDLAWAPAM